MLAVMAVLHVGDWLLMWLRNGLGEGPSPSCIARRTDIPSTGAVGQIAGCRHGRAGRTAHDAPGSTARGASHQAVALPRCVEGRRGEAPRPASWSHQSSSVAHASPVPALTPLAVAVAPQA